MEMAHSAEGLWALGPHQSLPRKNPDHKSAFTLHDPNHVFCTNGYGLCSDHDFVHTSDEVELVNFKGKMLCSQMQSADDHRQILLGDISYV